MDKIKNILKSKHLFITGKTAFDRSNFVKKLISEVNFETFRFPPNMTNFNEYLNFVKEEKLYKPWYDSKSFSNNQIVDFHRDWITESNSLVILEEFEQMENRWKMELLRLYTNELIERKKGNEKIHLIVTLENENGILNNLAEIIENPTNERLTNSQIINQNIAHIEL
ncbi:MAG: hypothetical protein QM535_17730 [Limnohabitans sp.]|nr:hypothetical protein [Limnohabitans sp.]